MTVFNPPPVLVPLDAGSPNVILRTGCIRLGSNNSFNGPYFHVNSGHARVGHDGAGVTNACHLNANGNIEVHGNSVGGEEVAALLPFPDESMAKDHLMVGCTGSAGLCIIQIYSGGNLVDPKDAMFNGDLHNIWYLSVAVKSGGTMADWLAATSIITGIQSSITALQSQYTGLEARVAALEATC